jgi:hypothetical protein
MWGVSKILNIVLKVNDSPNLVTLTNFLPRSNMILFLQTVPDIS